MVTLTKGSKVYIDGFAGLIAGVVVSMNSQYTSEVGITSASVKVTARSGRGYYKGEVVVRPVTMVVPRECVRRRKYETRILPYQAIV